MNQDAIGWWHLDPSSRLATIDMTENRGPGYAPFRGELRPHLTQRRLGRRLPPYTKWHLDPSSRLVTIDMGRTLGGSALFEERGLGPHLTQSRRC